MLWNQGLIEKHRQPEGSCWFVLKITLPIVVVFSKGLKVQSLILKLSAVAMAAALTACGGGGGGSDPVPEQPTAFTVSGNAVKGPMNKALVVAYKVNADGTKGDELGRDESDEDGAYDIPVKGYTGVVLVEVTATADTTMKDESTGETIAAPIDFKLRASVASPEGSAAQGTTLAVQVNPLTEMAVAKAFKSEGGLTSANVETANAELRTVYGFSPTDDAPVFVNGVPQNKAAVILFAISNMAKNDDLEACAAEQTQASKVQCVVKEMADKGPQDDTVANAVTLQVAVVASQEGVPATAVPRIETVVPPMPAETTAVAQAKALISSLSSNAQALAAEDLSLQTKLTEVQTAVETGVQPVVESTFEMLRTMDFGVDLLEAAQAGSGVYSGNRQGLQYSAGCTVYTGAVDDTGKYTFRTTATSKDKAVVVGCSSYSSLNWNQQDDTTGVTNTWRWRHRLLISPKVDVPGTYVVETTARREYGTCANQAGSCGTFTQTFVGTANQGKPESTDFYPDNSGYSVQRGEAGTADFTRTFMDGNLTGLRLVGSTAPSLYYRGFGIPPVLDTYGQRHEVELDATKTTTDTVQRITLARDAFIKFFSRDTEAGPTVFRSSIGIGKDSYIQAPVEANANNGTDAFKLSIGYVAGNSALRGSLEATNALWDKSKTTYMPTKVVFGGRLETRESSSSEWVDFLRGSLTMEAVNHADFDSSAPLSASNPQTMKATLSGAVTIPNRPVLALKDLMIVNTDKGLGNQSSTLSGQYVQGSLVINVSGTSTNGAGKVALESTSGIKFDFDSSKTVHPMTKSGIKVGEYNESTKQIDYVDNSFDQF